MSKLLASIKRAFKGQQQLQAQNTNQDDNSQAVAVSNAQSASNAIKLTKNWYEERADSLRVQRNLLLISSFILMAMSIVSVVVVAAIVNSREFDPFVIQVDETTGMTTVVNPISSDMLEGNDALARYFIKKYVSARETYNPVDFSTEARKIVRLLSTNDILWNYIGYLRNKEVDPAQIYGQKNTTYMTIKSWSKLGPKRYMLRFSIHETLGDQKILNKLAVVDYDYMAMELSEAERDINPVGFQIKGYKVDDDNS